MNPQVEQHEQTVNVTYEMQYAGERKLHIQDNMQTRMEYGLE